MSQKTFTQNEIEEEFSRIVSQLDPMLSMMWLEMKSDDLDRWVSIKNFLDSKGSDK